MVIHSEPFAKLAQVQVQDTNCVLEALGTSDRYTFLVNPVGTDHSFSANYTTLPVLGTNQPLICYQNSQADLTFPDVRFYTSGNNRDLSPVLDGLRDLVLTQGDRGTPRVLKLIWGSFVVPRVVIRSLRYRVTQRRQGKPVEATGSLELLLAPEVPKAIKVPVTKLTDRERSGLVPKIKEKLKAKEVEVLEDGSVRVDGKPAGTIKDILGDQLPEGLKDIKEVAK